MRILIMGGTRFIGVYLTKVLVDKGHEIVLFNRGNKPAPVSGIQEIHGDRTNASQLREKLASEKFDAIFPELNLCTDNAAMIAIVGLKKFKKKKFDKLNFPVKPRWPLDKSAKFLKGAGVKL